MFDKQASRVIKQIIKLLNKEVTSSREGKITLEALIKREWNTIKLVYQTMTGRNVSLRASALTYITLISFIPMLAFIFSILKTFKVDYPLRYFIELIPGLNNITGIVLDFIKNTNFATLGPIGLVVTLLATFFTIGSMEKTINDIWGIQQKRPFFVRMSYHTSIIVLAPFIFTLSIGINALLAKGMHARFLPDIAIFQHALGILMVFLPYFVIWLLFTFIYKIIPYTNVRLTSAIFGAIVGGTLWQLTLMLYTKFQFGLSRYNVIYSGFASFPFFMIWLYLSWLMLILGAAAAYIHQNYSRFRESAGTEEVSYSFRERLALRVFMAIAQNFSMGKDPLTIDELAEVINIPVHLINEVLFTLQSEGLISSTAEEGTYLPSRDLSRIRFIDVLSALRNHGEQPNEHINAHEKRFLDDTLNGILLEIEKKYDRITFADLCKKHTKLYNHAHPGDVETTAKAKKRK